MDRVQKGHTFFPSIKNYGRYITIYRYPNYWRKHRGVWISRIRSYYWHQSYNGGDIRISIESQDVFAHHSDSYLIFEGRLTNADNTAYANADGVALTNNAIMHIFSRIEYHLSNQLIESLNYSGQATTMLGLLEYPDDFSKAQGLNQLWYKGTSTTAAKAGNNVFAARHAYLIQSPTVKGTFSFRSTSLVFLRTMTKFCNVWNKA